MTLLITKKCINCDMCAPECPNEAISPSEDMYKININRCTECIGYYEEPACQKVCPIKNAISKDSAHIESEKQLWNKFLFLHKDRKINSQ